MPGNGATCYYTAIPQALSSRAFALIAPPALRRRMPHDRTPPFTSSAATAPRMTPAERRATIGLSGIYGRRMLGMFIVLPVLALYVETLPGGRNHAWVGLALGAYGLTQA